MSKRAVTFQRDFHESGDDEIVDEDDLDLDTIRKRSSSRKIKDDYSSGSEEDIQNKPSQNEAESAQDTNKRVKDELGEWTRVDIRHSRLSSDSDEEEGEEAEAIPIEPFHMRTEMEEGKFNEETGGYVRNADEDVMEDEWLEGISKKEIRKAKKAHDERMAKQDEPPINNSTTLGKAQVIQELAAFMELGETVTETLQRRAPPSSTNRKFDRKSQRMATQLSPETLARIAQSKADIERITELATHLLETFGIVDVYELTKEELMRMSK